MFTKVLKMKSFKQFIREFEDELAFKPSDDMKSIKMLTKNQMSILADMLDKKGFEYDHTVKDDITSIAFFKNSLGDVISIRACFVDSTLPDAEIGYFEVPALFILDCKCSKSVARASEIIFDNMVEYESLYKGLYSIGATDAEDVEVEMQEMKQCYDSNTECMQDYLENYF